MVSLVWFLPTRKVNGGEVTMLFRSKSACCCVYYYTSRRVNWSNTPGEVADGLHCCVSANDSLSSLLASSKAPAAKRRTENKWHGEKGEKSTPALSTAANKQDDGQDKTPKTSALNPSRWAALSVQNGYVGASDSRGVYITFYVSEKGFHERGKQAAISCHRWLVI